MSEAVLSAKILGHPQGEAIDPDGHWLVTADPDSDLSPIQPIRQVSFDNPHLLTVLGYEISAWAHLSPQKGAALAETRAAIDIRSSLVNHFYFKTDLDINLTKKPHEDQIERSVAWALKAIEGLDLTVASGSLNIPGLSEDEADATAKSLEDAGAVHAASAIDSEPPILLADLAGIRLLISFLAEDTSKHDELVWYRHWLLGEGMRETLSRGNDLLTKCYQATSELSEVLGPSIKGDHLQRVLASRARLMDVVDDVQIYRLMIDTLETFRKGVDLNYLGSPLVAWQPQPPPPVTEFVKQEEFVTLARPIETTEKAIGNLVKTAEMRLMTLTDIANIGYNTKIQVVLRRLQWISISLALMALASGIWIGWLSLHNSATNTEPSRTVQDRSPSKSVAPSPPDMETTPPRTSPTTR